MALQAEALACIRVCITCSTAARLCKHGEWLK